MKQVLITIALVFSLADVFACLVLFITDGKSVLVANHEDWYARDAEITFIPASGKKHGMIYFDFASEKTAQAGMNTAGLFFDGTKTAFAPYAANDTKPDCWCYIWKKILEECGTVDEAIVYAQRYKIPEIEDIHVLFADKKGSAAVIGVYNGKLQVHRRTHHYQLLTNFNLSDPFYGNDTICSRFAAAEKLLHADSSATTANLEKILSQTHQEELTVYSSIYNLTTGEVYVYNRADFSRRRKLDLSEELKKGRHTISIPSLFE